jgi:hypothetical protein
MEAVPYLDVNTIKDILPYVVSADNSDQRIELASFFPKEITFACSRITNSSAARI